MTCLPADDVVTDVSWSRDAGMVASVTSRQALLVVTGITTDGTRQLTVAEELVGPAGTPRECYCYSWS